jgi:hypothetical protein
VIAWVLERNDSGGSYYDAGSCTMVQIASISYQRIFSLLYWSMKLTFHQIMKGVIKLEEGFFTSSLHSDDSNYELIAVRHHLHPSTHRRTAGKEKYKGFKSLRTAQC